MKGELFTLAGWLNGSRTTRDAVKITFAIPRHTLSREQLGALIQLASDDTEAWAMIKTAVFDKEEKDMAELLEVEPSDDSKTPSQQLRAALYVLWKEFPEGYEDFELFYRFRMTQYKNHALKKLNDQRT